MGAAFRPASRSIWFVALTLAIALALVLLPSLASNHAIRITQPLARIVPDVAEGWEVSTLDIAQSEEMKNQVLKVLRYDDMVYRSFRRGDMEVQVYAAYWRPGSVPYGQAGVHTPDTCWVQAGWTMEAKTNSREMAFGDERLKPVEWRRFVSGGRQIHVLFWHLVGGRVHTYDQYGWREGLAGVWERLPIFFRDLRQYGFNLEQEQVFVRISANVGFERLQDEPAFRKLLRSLEPLGILHGAQPGS